MSARGFDSASIRDSLGEAVLAPKETLLKILRPLTGEQLAAVFREERNHRNLLTELVLSAIDSDESYLSDFVDITKRIPTTDLLEIMKGNPAAAVQNPFGIVTTQNPALITPLFNMIEDFEPEQWVDLLMSKIGSRSRLITQLSLQSGQPLQHLDDDIIIHLIAHAANTNDQLLLNDLESQQNRENVTLFFRIARAIIEMNKKAFEYSDRESAARAAKYNVANALATYFKQILISATGNPLNMDDAAEELLDYWETLQNEYNKNRLKSTYALAIQSTRIKSFKNILTTHVLPILEQLIKEPECVYNQEKITGKFITRIYNLGQKVKAGLVPRENMISLLKKIAGEKESQAVAEKVAAIISARHEISEVISELQKPNTTIEKILKQTQMILDQMVREAIQNKETNSDSFPLFTFLMQLENTGFVKSLRGNEPESAKNTFLTSLDRLKEYFGLSTQLDKLKLVKLQLSDDAQLKLRLLANSHPDTLTVIFVTAEGRAILEHIARNIPSLMRLIIEKLSSENWDKIFDSAYEKNKNRDWNLLQIMIQKDLGGNKKQRENPSIFLEKVKQLKPENISKIISADLVKYNCTNRPDIIPVILNTVFELPSLDLQLPFWLKLFEPSDSESEDQKELIDHILVILKQIRDEVPLPARIALLQTATTYVDKDLLNCILLNDIPNLSVICSNIISLKQQKCEIPIIKELVDTLENLLLDIADSGRVDTGPVNTFLHKNSAELLKAVQGNTDLSIALGNLTQAFFNTRTASAVSIFKAPGITRDQGWQPGGGTKPEPH